jgi:hypothetical protein
MKHTFKYDNLISDNYIFSDYTSKYFKEIEDIDLSDFTKVIKIPNSEKLEALSHRLYGNAKYWDLLVIINSMAPLFDTPYDDGVITDNNDKFVNEYFDDVFEGNEEVPEEIIEEMKDFYIEEQKTKNDKFRFVRVIKPGNIRDVMKIIREKGHV